eukprot:1179315-Prorocentrum_minimum.AAC.3
MSFHPGSAAGAGPSPSTTVRLSGIPTPHVTFTTNTVGCASNYGPSFVTSHITKWTVQYKFNVAGDGVRFSIVDPMLSCASHPLYTTTPSLPQREKPARSQRKSPDGIPHPSHPHRTLDQFTRNLQDSGLLHWLSEEADEDLGVTPGQSMPARRRLLAHPPTPATKNTPKKNTPKNHAAVVATLRNALDRCTHEVQNLLLDDHVQLLLSAFYHCLCHGSFSVLTIFSWCTQTSNTFR